MLTDLHAAPPEGAVTVACRDVAGRSRVTLIRLLPDQQVMVMAPPGEIADLAAAEADRLRVEPTAGVTRWGPFFGTVGCSDAVGHPRAATVLSTGPGRVKVVAPAGAVAVFGPVELRSFGATLRVAVAALRVEAAIA